MEEKLGELIKTARGEFRKLWQYHRNPGSNYLGDPITPQKSLSKIHRVADEFCTAYPKYQHEIERWKHDPELERCRSGKIANDSPACLAFVEELRQIVR